MAIKAFSTLHNPYTVNSCTKCQLQQQIKKRVKGMPLVKEKYRIIYEAFLGKPIRAYQWKILKQQILEANLPLTVDNLRFVAKCKKIAPRKAIVSDVLALVAQSGTDLRGELKGLVIKEYILAKRPSISRDKFYRAFRAAGISYRNETTYSIAELGEVLYKLFV